MPDWWVQKRKDNEESSSRHNVERASNLSYQGTNDKTRIDERPSIKG